MNPMNSKVVNREQMLEVLLTAEDHTTMPLLVTGTSMQPFLINRRSVVELEKDVSRVPCRGDIVLFCRKDGSIVLHRIIGVDGDELLINGDAQSWTETIYPHQILAYVTHVCRRKRRFPVTNGFYRLCVRVWMPLRELHPLGARVFHIWHRIPYKLFPKYMAKKGQ